MSVRTHTHTPKSGAFHTFYTLGVPEGVVHPQIAETPKNQSFIEMRRITANGVVRGKMAGE